MSDNMFRQQPTLTDMVCTTQDGKEEEQDGSTTEEMSDSVVDLTRMPTPPPVIGKIVKIVLSGGPNGGKTTAIQVWFLLNHLSDLKLKQRANSPIILRLCFMMMMQLLR